MGKKSGGGGTSTQTVYQNADPWKPQQPYLTYGFGQAKNLYGRGGPQPFPNASYVPFSPQTEQAMGLQWNRALQGSPVLNEARGLTYDTLRGDYLSPDTNPYLQQYFQQGLEQSLPSLNATFSNAGRTGAEAQSQGLADTYGALSRDIYGGAYENERQRQMQSQLFAPQLAEADYGDIGRAMQVGQMVEGKAGESLQDQINRYTAQQQRPYANLESYLRNISGNFGTTGSSQSTGTEPSYGSPLGSALGGALSGAGMASMLWPGAAGAAGLAALGPMALPFALGGALLGGISGR